MHWTIQNHYASFLNTKRKYGTAQWRLYFQVYFIYGDNTIFYLGNVLRAGILLVLEYSHSAVLNTSSITDFVFVVFLFRQNPRWGAANIPYSRWLPAEYEDVWGVPRGWDPQHTYNNATLPPVRVLQLLSAILCPLAALTPVSVSGAEGVSGGSVHSQRQHLSGLGPVPPAGGVGSVDRPRRGADPSKFQHCRLQDRSGLHTHLQPGRTLLPHTGAPPQLLLSVLVLWLDGHTSLIVFVR